MSNDRMHFQVLDNFSALSGEGHDEEWKQLMALLNLPEDYLASVKLIWANGSWRNANDPVLYIRSAARSQYRDLNRLQRPLGRERCIAKLKLRRHEGDAFMEHDDLIDKLNKVPMDSESIEQYAMRKVQRKFLIADSPHEDAECAIDYSKLMDEVASGIGLSKTRRAWMVKVLVLRATADVSRAQMLSYPDVAARKHLQAAWRWLDRHKNLVAKVLSGPVLKGEHFN
jgi:hypothetical protein